MASGLSTKGDLASKILKILSTEAIPFLMAYPALAMAFAGVKILYAKAINVRNAEGLNDFSTKTICPPYQRMVTITPTPINSLTGCAKFCRFASRFDDLKMLCVICLNLLVKPFSTLNPLIIFIPLSVSSMCEINALLCCCTS